MAQQVYIVVIDYAFFKLDVCVISRVIIAPLHRLPRIANRKVRNLNQNREVLERQSSPLRGEYDYCVPMNIICLFLGGADH